MDWGFAPGGVRDPLDPEGQQERARRMIARRADTKLVDRPGPKKTPIGTVRGFIQYLTNTGSIPKPIDNVVLGGHADDEGNIFIPMFPGQRRATNYETLDDTLTNAKHSIKLTAVINGPGDHDVHFKGCNLGVQPKFLKKFKEALGATGVTAPKHFHGVRVDLGIGVTEFMAKEFVIRSPTKITDRNDLIAKFKGEDFKFIDGSLVPPERWDTWVPQNITSLGKNPVDETFQFSQSVGGETERIFPRQFRVENSAKNPFTWDLVPPTPFPPESGYLAALRADLKQAPQFTQNDGFFLFHERLGYKTIDQFVDGLHWKIHRGKKSKANKLFATGTRWEYVAVIPIVEPSTQHLVINFHPDNPAVFDPVIQLVENDDTFFGFV